MRLRLLIAYHGASFHGVAVQPDTRTVAGVVTETLVRILRLSDVPFAVVAGRTDSGVHGWGQVMHVDLPPSDSLDLERIARSLNKMLAPSVLVRSLDIAPEGFDARRSALWRRYRYTIENGPLPSPFLHDRAWHIPEPLNLTAMRLACDPFIGEHDFSSFCRKPRGQTEPSLRRTVLDARWEILAGPSGSEGRPSLGGELIGSGAPPTDGQLLCFEITATSFCQRMVRSIVGLMVDVGRGERHAGDILGLLDRGDRNEASATAPARGLVLWEVGYPSGMQPRVDLARRPNGS